MLQYHSWWLTFEFSLHYWCLEELHMYESITYVLPFQNCNDTKCNFSWCGLLHYPRRPVITLVPTGTCDYYCFFFFAMSQQGNFLLCAVTKKLLPFLNFIEKNVNSVHIIIQMKCRISIDCLVKWYSRLPRVHLQRR